ncbi:6337_t:CDS:2 [Rhizophagus irregularis]|nr:6337_t:CDS:2 [Rhizophagus irregularis]
MRLTNLLGGNRRSEPKYLLGLKIFTMIVLISGLTGYLAVLIVDVNQDAPIIITSYVNVDGVRAPNLHFGGVYNSSISCQEVHMVNDMLAPPVDCLEDTKLYYDEKINHYITSYQPIKNVFFSKKSLYYVTLKLVINEEFTLEKPWDMTLMAYDPEKDFFYQGRSDFVEESIFTLNTYSIMPSQDYRFTYSNIIREVIVPSWMNDFGVPPKYERKPYIISDLVQDKTSEQIISFTIQPKYSNTIQIDKELRTHTYLSGLGLIGGAWGLAAAIYTFLFGANILQPWGAVQSHCCGFSRLTQNKLKDSLPTVPFSDDPNTKDQINSLSLAEQNKLFLLRLNSLELFLQEYVVDVQYLDRIRDNVDTTNNTDDNQNTNSASFTTSETISSQQQNENLAITIPPNLTQTLTADSTPQSNKTYAADAPHDDIS